MVNGVIRLASHDDVIALPGHITGEIIDGELHTQPLPRSRHSRVETGLGRDLSGSFDLGRGGRAAGSPSPSPNSTSASMCWYRTLPAGAASACR